MSASEEPAAPSAPRPKVLIVDDDRNILQVFTISLGAYGVDVITAENGMNGFTIALTEEPDVIVTDYTMPGGSGDYFIGRLKREPETRDIPVIVLTGRKFEGQEDMALKRDMLGRGGAVAYLSKPVALDALLGELQKHVTLGALA